MEKITLKTVYFNKNNKEDRARALIELSNDDLDFSGENAEYIKWEEALDFNSNRDYLLDLIKPYSNNDDAITDFIEIWLNEDCYYENYEFNIVEINDIVVVSLAYN